MFETKCANLIFFTSKHQLLHASLRPIILNAVRWTWTASWPVTGAFSSVTIFHNFHLKFTQVYCWLHCDGRLWNPAEWPPGVQIGGGVDESLPETLALDIGRVEEVFRGIFSRLSGAKV